MQQQQQQQQQAMFTSLNQHQLTHSEQVNIKANAYGEVTPFLNSNSTSSSTNSSKSSLYSGSSSSSSSLNSSFNQTQPNKINTTPLHLAFKNSTNTSAHLANLVQSLEQVMSQKQIICSQLDELNRKVNKFQMI
jgi:hypothetical protein